MIKTIIFDFDGVILESSEIKTLAFHEMFASESSDVQKEMMEYHLTNMGFSRQRKFEYYYNHILNEPIPDGVIDQMSDKFKKIVLEQILKAPYVAGMPEFLKKYHEKYQLFIATGTPDEEIKIITDSKGISKYFKGIYGTPDTKEEIIQRILLDNNLNPADAVFFGDAESDRVSAQATGVNFIGRIGHGSDKMCETKHKILDFTDIEGISNIINSFI